MPPQDYNENQICYSCVGDKLLSEAVRKDGSKAECAFCGVTSESISLNDFATRIQEVIEKYFKRSSSEPDYWDSIRLREGLSDFWLPDGDQIVQLIADIAIIEEEIASTVTDCLASRFSYEAAKYGEENPYGSDAYYEERAPNDLALRFSWQEFCREIKYRDRFFPENTELVLDDIFGKLQELETFDESPVIRNVAPSDETFQIWRARTAETNRDLASILGAPVEQLGPPPPEKAEAGRMSPKGISVFYGALDKSTCVAEVRPPVGSRVVYGKFNLIRTARLLDLAALAKVYGKASYFDPDYATIKGRAAFIRHLAEEISKPIMPREGEREYLPTQFVASYLARKANPLLDGIIFPSSQVEGEGQNLVLFNHAREVEQYDLPKNSEVRVYPPSTYDEDKYIFISETVPSNLEIDEAESAKPPQRPIRIENVGDAEDSHEDLVSTLELDVETIECIEVTNVKYLTEDLTVFRHRQTYEEQDKDGHDFEPEIDFNELDY